MAGDVTTGTARRIRACGAEAAETQVKRRMEAAHRLGAGPAEIARALRQARKSAIGRLGAYDPVAHAALLRLAKGARKPATRAAETRTGRESPRP